MADYWSRIRDQEGVYDTVTAEEGPFIKVMNVGERIEANRIEGEFLHVWSSLNYRIFTVALLFLLDEHPHSATHDLLCSCKATRLDLNDADPSSPGSH